MLKHTLCFIKLSLIPSLHFLPQIANDIRHLIRDYNKMIPTLLEIPSKDHAYDPEQDSIMTRVNMILGFQG